MIMFFRHPYDLQEKGFNSFSFFKKQFLQLSSQQGFMKMSPLISGQQNQTSMRNLGPNADQWRKFYCLRRELD